MKYLFDSENTIVKEYQEYTINILNKNAIDKLGYIPANISENCRLVGWVFPKAVGARSYMFDIDENDTSKEYIFDKCLDHIFDINNTQYTEEYAEYLKELSKALSEDLNKLSAEYRVNK